MEPDELSAEASGGHHPGLVFFLGLSFSLFIVGGLFFGFIFLVNLRTLVASSSTGEVVVDVPVAGPVNVGKLPQLPSVPQLPQIQIPNISSNLPQVNPSALLPEWQGNKPVVVLLLGVDKRPDENVEQTRTDTMMLLIANPKTSSAMMVSLPRDLWVSIPGYGEQRINVAHAVGGPALAKKTVEGLIGTPVDFYARVDFNGFEQVVDTLGGVLVDVERPIKDDEYPGENYSYMRIYIAPGPQLMDGKTALQYVRSRHSENDFGRMRRQQRFLVAMRDRALKLNVLPKLPSLIGLVQQTVATDVGPTQILALARLGSEIDRERIASLVLDTRFADPYRSPEGADLLLPRHGAIRAAVRELVTATEAPAAARPSIEVLNGSERAGAAQAAADFLTAEGYQVASVGNADRRDYRDTSVVVLKGDVKAGHAVATALKLPASAVREARGEGAAELRIIIGSSFRAPQ